MEWLSVAQVAAILKVSPTAVHGLMKRGRLPWSKVGRWRVIQKRAVLELLQSPTYRQQTRRQVSIQELEEAGQMSFDPEKQE